MRKELFLLVLSVFVGAECVAMKKNESLPPLPEEEISLCTTTEDNEPLPLTPKETINTFLVAKNKGRAGVKAFVVSQGEESDKAVIVRSDFRKTERELYEKHVVPAIMKNELALKANTHFYIDEPFPETILLVGADGMRPGLLAKMIAQTVGADYQEILDWRAKGVLDVMKGFGVTGEEKKDKVILVRDIARFGRDLQGVKEQSHTVLYDKLKDSIKALHQRKHQVDHRVYVIAATAYEDAVPADIKALFKNTYPLVIPDTKTAGAIIRDFVKMLNGGDIELSDNFVKQLQGFSFDDLKDIANDAAKEAALKDSSYITIDHLMGVLAKSKEHHEKIVSDRAELLTKLCESHELLPDKDKSIYPFFVEQQVPANLRSFFEQRASLALYYQEAPVFVLFGERGLGKTMTARALAERRNAELVSITVESLLDPVVGKTQKNVEHLFEELKQKAMENKPCVVMLRGVEYLFSADIFGDEGYESKSIRASLLTGIKELNDQIVLLLCADTPKNKVHQEVLSAVGSERCVEFVKPKESALKQALLTSLSVRLIKQKEMSIDFSELAQKAEAFTCADYENVVRSAARKALDENAQEVAQEHFDCAMSCMSTIVRERGEGATLRSMYN